MTLQNFIKNFKEFLNKNSPLRIFVDEKFQILNGDRFYIKSSKSFYSLECSPYLTYKKFNAGKHFIPMFEISCMPVSNTCVENLYCKEVMEAILKEETNCFNKISIKPGNKTWLLIHTDLQVLPEQKSYGLSIFENIGVVKGFDLILQCRTPTGVINV